MLIIQQDLDWKHVLESKIIQVGLKYSLPKAKYNIFLYFWFYFINYFNIQTRISILQEYAIRYFSDFEMRVDFLDFKSIIHGNVLIKSIGLNFFIFAFINMTDCLLKKFAFELKQTNEGMNMSKMELFISNS